MSTPTYAELHALFRATGFVTNGQAADLADLVELIFSGADLSALQKKAEQIREENFGA